MSDFDKFDKLDRQLQNSPKIKNVPKEKAPKGRKPISDFKAGAVQGIKETRIDAALMNSIAKHTMPNTTRFVGDTMKIASDLDTIRKDATKQLQPTISSLKQAGRRILPRLKDAMPKKLYNKLEKITQPDEEGYSPESEENLRQDSIESAIREVFSGQTDIAIQQQQENLVSQQIDRTIGARRHLETASRLDQQGSLLKSLVTFQHTTTANYMAKSLRLKYQHVFIARDTYALMKTFAESSEQKLEAIKVNTGLPDIQKQKLSESYKEHMRATLSGKVNERLDEFSRSWRDKVGKNLNDKFIQPALQGLIEGGNAVSDATNMYGDMKDMEESMDEFTGGRKKKRPGITGEIGGFIGRNMARVGLGKVASGAGKLLTGQYGKDLESLMGNLNQQMGRRVGNFLEDSDSDNPFITILRELVEMPSEKRGSISKNLLDKGTEAVPFDLLTRRSIIEIIPGYLSRILQQVTTVATGKPAERLTYNIRSEKFDTLRNARKSIKEDMFGDKESRQYNFSSSAKNVFTGFKQRGGSTKEFEKYLPDLIAFLQTSARAGRDLSAKEIQRFSKDKKYQSNYIDSVFKDVKDKQGLAKLLTKSLFNDNGEIDPSAVTELSRSIGNSMNNVDDHIATGEKYASLGQQELLDQFTDKSGKFNYDVVDLIQRDVSMKDIMSNATNYVDYDIKRRAQAESARGFAKSTIFTDLDKRQDGYIKTGLTRLQQFAALGDKGVGYLRRKDGKEMLEDLQNLKETLLKKKPKNYKETVDMLDRILDDVKAKSPKSIDEALKLFNDRKNGALAILAGCSEELIDEILTKADNNPNDKTLQTLASSIRRAQALKQFPMTQKSRNLFRRVLNTFNPAASNEVGMDEVPLTQEEITAALKNIVSDEGISQAAQKMNLNKVFGKSDDNIDPNDPNVSKTLREKIADQIRSGKDELKGSESYQNAKSKASGAFASAKDAIAGAVRSAVTASIETVQKVGDGLSSTESLNHLRNIDNSTAQLVQLFAAFAPTNEQLLSKQVELKVREMVADGKMKKEESSGFFGKGGDIAKRGLGGVLKGLGRTAKFMGKVAYKDIPLAFIKGGFGVAKNIVGKANLGRVATAASVFAKAGFGFGKVAVKGYASLLNTGIRGTFGLAKTAVKSSLTAVLNNPYRDVYRKDKIEPGNPLLTSKKVREGVIFQDGSRVKDVADISRPVLDPKTQETLISEDDIRIGLVDIHGTPITKKGISPVGAVIRGIGAVGKAGLGIAGKFFTGANPLWSLYGGMLKGAGKVAGGIGKGVANFFGLGGPREGGGFLGGLSGGLKRKDIEELLADRLDIIIGLMGGTPPKDKEDKFTERTPRKGFRSILNTAKERLQARKQALKEKMEQTRAEKAAEDDGDTTIIDNSSDGKSKGKKTKTGPKAKGIKGFMKNAASKGGSVLKGGAKMVGKAGLLSMITGGSLISGATSLAASAATSVAGSVIPALGAFASTIGGAAMTGLSAAGSLASGAIPFLVSNPIGWGILGAVALGAAGYGIYTLMKDKGNKKLMEMRLSLYGTSAAQEPQVKNLEKFMYDAYESGYQLKDKDIEKFGKDFGFDPKDRDQMTWFKTWMEKRMSPTYSLYIKILKEAFKKTPSEEDELEENEVKTLLSEIPKQCQRYVDTWNEIVPTMAGYNRYLTAHGKIVKKGDKKDLDNQTDKQKADKNNAADAVVQNINATAESKRANGGIGKVTPFKNGVTVSATTGAVVGAKVATDSLGGGISKEALANIDKQVGSLSAHYESGTKGTGAVGNDSTGGASYGKYQISSRRGTFATFLKWLTTQPGEGPAIAQALSQAGNPDMGRNGPVAKLWKELAAAGKLSEYEHAFIKETHFDDALKRLPPELAAKIMKSKTLQDVLWSTAVQHGAPAAASIFTKTNDGTISDNKWVSNIYAYRGTQFKNSTIGERQSVSNRFAHEKRVAMSGLEVEQLRSTAGGDTRTASIANTTNPSGAAVTSPATSGEQQVASLDKSKTAEQTPAQQELVAKLDPDAAKTNQAIVATLQSIDKNISTLNKTTENSMGQVSDNLQKNLDKPTPAPTVVVQASKTDSGSSGNNLSGMISTRKSARGYNYTTS